MEVQGLQQGLNHPKRSNTEQKCGTATRQTTVKTSICDRRITYEPGGRGFKSCRARQLSFSTSTAWSDHRFGPFHFSGDSRFPDDRGERHVDGVLKSLTRGRTSRE